MFVEKALNRAIRVGCYKVDRHVVLCAVVECFLDPSIAGRRGAADTVRFVYAFDRADTVLIELEILCLSIGSESVEAGLIPDFEIPLANFVSPVAFGKVPCELLDEFAPLLVRLGLSQRRTAQVRRPAGSYS